VAIKGNLKHANIGKNQHFRIDLRLLLDLGWDVVGSITL
jgi:hypothetical protein